MSAQYLNVDCIMKSRFILDDLITSLGKDVFVVWSSYEDMEHAICLETNLLRTEHPAEDIAEFLRLFSELPIEKLQCLNNCHEKRFDIGFESDTEGEALDTTIESGLIGRIHNLGFSISIRIYPKGKERPSCMQSHSLD